MEIVVYFALSCLLLGIFTMTLLEARGLEISIGGQIFIFGLICLSVIYNIYCVDIGDFFYICRMVYILPFLIAISLVDASSQWVFDIDVMGGLVLSESILVLEILEILLDTGNTIDKIGPLIYNNVVGVLVLVGLSYGLHRFTKGLGMGDVLVYAMVGTMGGLLDSLAVFFLSFISAGLYCVIILINTRKKDGLIAFTPFISIGFIVTYEIMIFI